MRIVWISHSAGLAGAERCLSEAVSSLHGLDYEHYIVVPMKGPFIGLLRRNASVIEISHPWWISEYKSTRNPLKRLFQYSRAVFRLRKLMKNLRPDLVITNSLVAPSGALAAKMLGIPHIWYIHEFVEEDHGMSFEFGRRFSLSVVNIISDRVITNSEVVFNKFASEIAPSKMDIIHYAVENPLQLGHYDKVRAANTYFHLVLIGRQAEGKGQEDALRALALIDHTTINPRLWLVGGGESEYSEHLKVLARELGVHDRVDFIPFVPNPIAYMLSADAVLMCSKSEAFGRVIVEAMKQGKPVIAANAGAVPELIRDGWNGMIYEAGSAQSLAEKIQTLFGDSNLRQSIGVNSSTWANEKFNFGNYGNDLQKVFAKTFK